TREVDWVDAVCKKLPALAVLEGFGFADDDVGFILHNIERLTKLMLPNKSEQQIADVNTVSTEVCARVEQHLLNTAALRTGEDSDEMLAVYVANLIGLLIQSYDAGRGILSNALLQALAQRERGSEEALVTETLRFDPPIHNTRRILVEDMELAGQALRRGDTVLVVLAAANRDPAIFTQPDRFNPARPNKGEHLAFGAGIHQCAAQHFSVRLAADALAAVFADGRHIELLQTAITYEPMINARLPQQLMISVR
ncbi:MAG: cytochrome P450, partial [Noviherbaspirillum sp.]